MKTNILFIYDVSKTLDAIKLELDSELFVIEACNGFNTAKEKLSVLKYDIVILSYDDDNFNDAVAMIQLVRSKSILIDIIAYSHSYNLENILKIYKAGSNDFILAPIEPKILKAKILSMSKKYEILNSKYFNNIVKYGDFVVDRDANLVFLKNVQVDFTKKEYRIIRHLMKANGTPVSKAELQKAIWGYEDNKSKIVEVTVSQIKKKLNNKYLKTVLKEGYILESK